MEFVHYHPLPHSPHPRPHPLFKVLLFSAIIVAIFSAGLKSIELTTDPVELWSSPNSRARQEKDFHDRNFGPFFRTNQLILTAPDRTGHVYDSLLFGRLNLSEVLSKDLILELLALQQRIQVKKRKIFKKIRKGCHCNTMIPGRSEHRVLVG